MRLTVSDGANSSLSTPQTITVGSPPTATINSPTDGHIFRAGDVITYTGDATDQEDGTLPPSAYTWNIDFLHDNHVDPGTAIAGVKSGSFTIPTSGHDFEGNTRYRIKLTVADSNGLRTSKSLTIFPDKVNLPFDMSPSGLTLYVDGVARTTPFVLDTLAGFNTRSRRATRRPATTATLQLVVGRRCSEPHRHGAERVAVLHRDLYADSATPRRWSARGDSTRGGGPPRRTRPATAIPRAW